MAMVAGLEARRSACRVCWRDLLQYPDGTVFVCEGEKDCDRVAELACAVRPLPPEYGLRIAFKP